jgi:RHS repeat-associated protein
MLETAPDLRSARPCTGEPSTTFGCTEASTTVWRCFDVHSINASVGPSTDEATTATWRYQSNQQYSITAVTTSSGSAAERYAYTAYGQPTILDASGSVLSSSAINNRYTYTGREWDGTLGLYHFRTRWMSGLAGRFMGRDPIGFEGSEWGLYELFSSEPLISKDPSGLRNCNADWRACRREADAAYRDCVRRGGRACEAWRSFDYHKCTAAYHACMDPPKSGNNLIKRVCGKVFGKINLVQCESDCVVSYQACLESSIREYEGCLSNPYYPQWLCDRIFNLNITAFPADYAACGLRCLTPF